MNYLQEVQFLINIINSTREPLNYKYLSLTVTVYPSFSLVSQQ